MIILYLFVVLAAWVALKVSSNYKVILFARRFVDVSFYVIFIWAAMTYASIIVVMALVAKNTDSIKDAVIIFGMIVGGACVLPLLFRGWKWLWHVTFYNSSHVKYLEKFTLYLRNFKDDKKRTLVEYVLMNSLYDYLYAPFAVGRPDEMKPSSSSIPIYIGEDWKERVKELMQKAPLILMRVSDTGHFLWELGICVDLQFVYKTLFWVTDKKTYMSFKSYCFERFGLQFPELEYVSENCVIYLVDSEFKIFHLVGKKSYKAFCLEIQDKMNFQSDAYLYRRDHPLRLFFRFHYDDKVSAEVQKWDWMAFLFPEFYVFFHRIKIVTILLLMVLICMPLLPLGLLYKCGIIQVGNSMAIITLVCMIVLRLFFMFLCGKNARTIEWYEEKWEGVSYFNRMSRMNNIMIMAYVAGFIVLLSFLYFI